MLHPSVSRPPFAAYPVVTAERLVLRQIAPADVPRILPISFFEGNLARTLAEAHEMQTLIRRKYDDGSSIHWGFALAADPAHLIGTGGFYRGFSDDIGEIGYVLLPAFRGKGYATEGARAMARFGFETLGLRQITALTDPDNLASQAVLRRAGFREVPQEPTQELRRFALDRPE